MGPRAPGSPKKEWNCIGFIRPGASGPRGCGKLVFCKFRNNFFYISDENMEFRIKKWNFKKFNHFAHLQTLAQTNAFTMSIRCLSKCPGHAHPISPKNWNFHIFSLSGPKSALFGPEWDFGGPCVKPFINTTFWEVFWRPRAGKVHFSPKNWKFRPKTEIHRKCSFCVKKWFSRRTARNLTKCYLFCFKA